MTKQNLKNIEEKDILVYDLETTGVDPFDDEILQLAIIDGNGETLYNNYLKPTHHHAWKKAQLTNHISPEMVKDKPIFKNKVDEILEIFSSAKIIVGYNNTNFDNDFLINADQRFKPIFDATPQRDIMLEYAYYNGEWDDYHECYRWKKLGLAAHHFNFQSEGNLHDALEDCKATLFVAQNLDEIESKKLKKGA